MATFQQWLQEQEPRQDMTGELARWWAGEAATRPRVSSPSGIERYMVKMLREGNLAQLGDEQKGAMREAFAEVVREYHGRDGQRQEAGGGHAAAQVPDGLAETLQRVTDRLDQIWGRVELIYRRQEKLMRAEGFETAESTATAPGAAGDYDWPSLYLVADHQGAATAEADTEAA